MSCPVNIVKVWVWLAFAMLLLAVFPASAQSTGPRLAFVEDKHEFGEIPVDTILRDTAIYVDVLYTNIGDEPLTISRINACCGSQVVSRPQEPLYPGDTATIKLNLNLKPRTQTFLRAITVYSNSSRRPAQVFQITGTVTYGHKP